MLNVWEDGRGRIVIGINAYQPRGRKLLYQVSKRVVVEAYYNKQIVSSNIQPPSLLHF
jgi:hypothetical protein